MKDWSPGFGEGTIIPLRRRRSPVRERSVGEEPTVVIFGGGGSRGFLHGGFIRALMESPVKIASLDGISIGSWAASFYALGMTIDEMQKAVIDFDAGRAISVASFLGNLMKRGSSYRGIFDHDRLRAMVESVIGKATFSDVVMPLRVQATDIATGRPFIFSKETTPDAEISLAIAASSALAGIFEPVTYDGRTLVDGTYAGYILPENRPTIISNVSPVRESQNIREKSIITLMMRSNSFLPQILIDDYKRRNPQVLEIVHDCRDIGMLTFGVAEKKKWSLMARSYDLCKEALTEYVESGRLGCVVAA